MPKWLESLLGFRMTMISGLFLAISAYFHLRGQHPAWDPGWVTLLISGFPVAIGAFISLIKERQITSWLLVTLAMGACLLLNEIFAAAEIAWIIVIGELLEAKTVQRARKGLSELLSRTPTEGRKILPDGTEVTVPLDQLEVGDKLRILPGELIPVDGTVLSGTSAVNEAMLTGEPVPADKQPGTEVFSGTMNGFGALIVEALRVGEDSAVQRLVQLVREAEQSKAPVQRTVDRWVTWLVPASIGLAAATLAFGTFSGLTLNDATYRAVTILIIFCPCALALATPTAVIAAIGQATKSGVIIKSGTALEEMGRIDTMALDKTGTLTVGRPTVTEVANWTDTYTAEEILTYAAAAERNSEHPLARAILAAAEERGIEAEEPAQFGMTAGRGVRAELTDGAVVHCGNEAFLEEENIHLRGQDQLATWREKGIIAILVAINGEHVGAVGFADELRENIQPVMADLNAAKITTLMLTGDNHKTANYVGEQIGISAVHARLLPEEKADFIMKLQEKGHYVAMVGDGINDSIALQRANVGIAMGDTAGAMATEASDIVLPGDDVLRLPYLVKLSRVTLFTIRVNIILALTLNVIGAIMAMLGWMSPVVGAIYHNVGVILIILHAVSLYERDLNPHLTKEKIKVTRKVPPQPCPGYCRYRHVCEYWREQAERS